MRHRFGPKRARPHVPSLPSDDADGADHARPGVARSGAVPSAHRHGADENCPVTGHQGWLGADERAGEPSESAPFWRGHLHFDVHLWGDPDPTGQNPLWDFSTTTELYREFVIAWAQNLGNIPNVNIGEGVWRQPTDDKRLGRLLVVPVAWAADISQEPWIVLPYATSTTDGVQVDTTVEMSFPDGSTSVAGVIVAPPP